MDFPIRIPFIDALGAQLVSMHGGRAELALDLQPAQCNSFGVAHGGVIMTLLDVAMAHAARSNDKLEAPAQPMSVVTIDMNTSFTQPGRGRLHAHGHMLHRAGRLAFCEGRIVDAHGQAVAHAMATFSFVPAPHAKPQAP